MIFFIYFNKGRFFFPSLIYFFSSSTKLENISYVIFNCFFNRVSMRNLYKSKKSWIVNEVQVLPDLIFLTNKQVGACFRCSSKGMSSSVQPSSSFSQTKHLAVGSSVCEEVQKNPALAISREEHEPSKGQVFLKVTCL